MDANIEVDPGELQRLAVTGIVHPELNAEVAVRQALALRLDYANAIDQVDDALRKVQVAANGLGGDVDLAASASVGTPDTKPADFRFDPGSYRVGIDADLPIDRKAERNTYRRTLIELNRTRRSADLLRDQVKLDVRQAWRELEEARDGYLIQQASLELARARVESTTLLLQAGRANTRDLLEAQAALLDAQNALTSRLVGHTLAKLRLWRDIGVLTVSDE